MCDNPSADGAETLMPRRLKFDRSKICTKCKELPGNVVIRHAVYCKKCFLQLVTIKFRRGLESTLLPDPSSDPSLRNVLKASGNLLIGLSGGLGSTVLLDLVHRSYNSTSSSSGQDGKPRNRGKQAPQRRKDVWNKVMVGYVEMCAAYPGTKDRTDEARGMVEKCAEIEFVPLRIENVFDGEWWKRMGGKGLQQLSVDLNVDGLKVKIPAETCGTPRDALQSFIASLPTPTAVASLLRTLTRLLLLYAARSTGSSHLLLGTSLTSFSVSLISSIAQGGGFNVREEQEETWKDVRLIRPLRELGGKECATYMWWNELSVLPGGITTTKEQGIGKLTRDFIVGLEKNFPSTVSTVARTCGKLVPKGDTDMACVVCERPAQAGVQEWKTRISIWSRTALAPDEPVKGAKSLAPYLCYGCHTSLTSRSSRGGSGLVPSMALPRWTGENLTQLGRAKDEVREGNRLAMKREIEEFLIDDTEEK
ncbi:hypothetical protein BOTBODRAFT_31411 [Botryobasidium botryosum FD-172 SS1]|uniref:Cytoplasmic tRNA 2-thiolation protein 2 n=1 Tax=Botryobasidium botryosum (strain FD-172 SS1) TaxID=930990 RepID=A0A067MVQ9_BOTB1|nr:hypothetical protein BOTBODRAFT_31411 [Botryobasidium botryosum FD-172 SS1]